MKLVLQRGDGDCGLAALATLVEATYEDTYVAMAKVEPHNRGKAGLWNTDIVAAAGRMGVVLKRKHAKVDLDEDEGILTVNWKNPKEHPFPSHYVVLSHGMILDPADAVVLDAEEYLERFNGKPGGLLVRK